MRDPRRKVAIVVAFTLLGALAACTGHRPPPPTPSAEQLFDSRAARVVAAWPQTDLAKAWSTGFVPLQPLTIGPPDAKLTEYVRLALTYQGYTFRVSEAPAGSSRGHIVFADGSTLAVPLETWSAARKLLTRPDHLPACTATGSRDGSAKRLSSQTSVASYPCSLTVTGVRLGTTTMLTSRGSAVVPAWLLTATQVAKPIARVAIPLFAATIETPQAGTADSTNTWNKPTSLVSVTGNKVTFDLMTGSGCSGGVVRPLVYETPTAVVVGGTIIGANRTLTPGVGCVDIGYIKSETVTLTAPLGVRPLLNIDTGLPVFMGVAPGTESIR